MSIWTIIPTIDEAMSKYTLIALCIFATIAIGIGAIAYWWISNELKELKLSIQRHEAYIGDTAEVFSKIHTKLAVQESSMETLKKDITVIMADVKTLLSR